MTAIAHEQGLAFELRRAVTGEVRFDPGSRHLYATDASNYRHVPAGVVLPRSEEDVAATVELCRPYGTLARERWTIHSRAAVLACLTARSTRASPTPRPRAQVATQVA